MASSYQFTLEPTKSTLKLEKTNFKTVKLALAHLALYLHRPPVILRRIREGRTISSSIIKGCNCHRGDK